MSLCGKCQLARVGNNPRPGDIEEAADTIIKSYKTGSRLPSPDSLSDTATRRGTTIGMIVYVIAKSGVDNILGDILERISAPDSHLTNYIKKDIFRFAIKGSVEYGWFDLFIPNLTQEYGLPHDDAFGTLVKAVDNNMSKFHLLPSYMLGLYNDYMNFAKDQDEKNAVNRLFAKFYKQFTPEDIAGLATDEKSSLHTLKITFPWGYI